MLPSKEKVKYGFSFCFPEMLRKCQHTSISQLLPSPRQVVDSNPRLKFQLHLMKYVEIIRGGDMDGALTFAQQELASYLCRHCFFFMYHMYHKKNIKLVLW